MNTQTLDYIAINLSKTFITSSLSEVPDKEPFNINDFFLKFLSLLEINRNNFTKFTINEDFKQLVSQFGTIISSIKSANNEHYAFFFSLIEILSPFFFLFPPFQNHVCSSFSLSVSSSENDNMIIQTLSSCIELCINCIEQQKSEKNLILNAIAILKTILGVNNENLESIILPSIIDFSSLVWKDLQSFHHKSLKTPLLIYSIESYLEKSSFLPSVFVFSQYCRGINRLFSVLEQRTLFLLYPIDTLDPNLFIEELSTIKSLISFLETITLISFNFTTLKFDNFLYNILKIFTFCHQHIQFFSWSHCLTISELFNSILNSYFIIIFSNDSEKISSSISLKVSVIRQLLSALFISFKNFDTFLPYDQYFQTSEFSSITFFHSYNPTSEIQMNNLALFSSQFEMIIDVISTLSDQNFEKNYKISNPFLYLQDIISSPHFFTKLLYLSACWHSYNITHIDLLNRCCSNFIQLLSTNSNIFLLIDPNSFVQLHYDLLLCMIFSNDSSLIAPCKTIFSILIRLCKKNISILSQLSNQLLCIDHTLLLTPPVSIFFFMFQLINLSSDNISLDHIFISGFWNSFRSLYNLQPFESAVRYSVFLILIFRKFNHDDQKKLVHELLTRILTHELSSLLLISFRPILIIFPLLFLSYIYDITLDVNPEMEELTSWLENSWKNYETECNLLSQLIFNILSTTSLDNILYPVSDITSVSIDRIFDLFWNLILLLPSTSSCFSSILPFYFNICITLFPSNIFLPSYPYPNTIFIDNKNSFSSWYHVQLMLVYHFSGRFHSNIYPSSIPPSLSKNPFIWSFDILTECISILKNTPNSESWLIHCNIESIILVISRHLIVSLSYNNDLVQSYNQGYSFFTNKHNYHDYLMIILSLLHDIIDVSFDIIHEKTKTFTKWPQASNYLQEIIKIAFEYSLYPPSLPSITLPSISFSNQVDFDINISTLLAKIYCNHTINSLPSEMHALYSLSSSFHISLSVLDKLLPFLPSNLFNQDFFSSWHTLLLKILSNPFFHFSQKISHSIFFNRFSQHASETETNFFICKKVQLDKIFFLFSEAKKFISNYNTSTDAKMFYELFNYFFSHLTEFLPIKPSNSIILNFKNCINDSFNLISFFPQIIIPFIDMLFKLWDLNVNSFHDVSDFWNLSILLSSPYLNLIPSIFFSLPNIFTHIYTFISLPVCTNREILKITLWLFILFAISQENLSQQFLLFLKQFFHFIITDIHTNCSQYLLLNCFFFLWIPVIFSTNYIMDSINDMIIILHEFFNRKNTYSNLSIAAILQALTDILDFFLKSIDESIDSIYSKNIWCLGQKPTVLYTCHQCEENNICNLCAIQCHIGHDVAFESNNSLDCHCHHSFKKISLLKLSFDIISKANKQIVTNKQIVNKIDLSELFKPFSLIIDFFRQSILDPIFSTEINRFLISKTECFNIHDMYSFDKEYNFYLTNPQPKLFAYSKTLFFIGEESNVNLYQYPQTTDVDLNKEDFSLIDESVLPFHIRGIVINPIYNHNIAIYGLQKCIVFTYTLDFSSKTCEVILELAFETYDIPIVILNVEWLPFSPYHLVITTNKFIKIFNLSSDNIFPILSFIVEKDDVLINSCFINYSSNFILFALSNTGNLFKYNIEKDLFNHQNNPIKLTHYEIIFNFQTEKELFDTQNTKHENNYKTFFSLIGYEDEDDTVKCLSIHWSLNLQQLFVSFSNGKLLCLTFNTSNFQILSHFFFEISKSYSKSNICTIVKWIDVSISLHEKVIGTIVKISKELFLQRQFFYDIVFFLQAKETFVSIPLNIHNEIPIVSCEICNKYNNDDTRLFILYQNGELYEYILKITKISSNQTKINRYFDLFLPLIKEPSQINPLVSIECNKQIKGLKFHGDNFSVKSFEYSPKYIEYSFEDALQNVTNNLGLVGMNNPALLSFHNQNFFINSVLIHIPEDSNTISIHFLDRIIDIDSKIARWYHIILTPYEYDLANKNTFFVFTFHGVPTPKLDAIKVYGTHSPRINIDNIQINSSDLLQHSLIFLEKFLLLSNKLPNNFNGSIQHTIIDQVLQIISSEAFLQNSSQYQDFLVNWVFNAWNYRSNIFNFLFEKNIFQDIFLKHISFSFFNNISLYQFIYLLDFLLLLTCQNPTQLITLFFYIPTFLEQILQTTTCFLNLLNLSPDDIKILFRSFFKLLKLLVENQKSHDSVSVTLCLNFLNQHLFSLDSNIRSIVAFFVVEFFCNFKGPNKLFFVNEHYWNCYNCKARISHLRYHCFNCFNIDLCRSCFDNKDYFINLHSHKHSIKPIPIINYKNTGDTCDKPYLLQIKKDFFNLILKKISLSTPEFISLNSDFFLPIFYILYHIHEHLKNDINEDNYTQTITQYVLKNITISNDLSNDIPKLEFLIICLNFFTALIQNTISHPNISTEFFSYCINLLSFLSDLDITYFNSQFFAEFLTPSRLLFNTINIDFFLFDILPSSFIHFNFKNSSIFFSPILVTLYSLAHFIWNILDKHLVDINFVNSLFDLSKSSDCICNILYILKKTFQHFNIIIIQNEFEKLFSQIYPDPYQRYQINDLFIYSLEMNSLHSIISSNVQNLDNREIFFQLDYCTQIKIHDSLNAIFQLADKRNCFWKHYLFQNQEEIYFLFNCTLLFYNTLSQYEITRLFFQVFMLAFSNNSPLLQADDFIDNDHSLRLEICEPTKNDKDNIKYYDIISNFYNDSDDSEDEKPEKKQIIEQKNSSVEVEVPDIPILDEHDSIDIFSFLNISYFLFTNKLSRFIQVYLIESQFNFIRNECYNFIFLLFSHSDFQQKEEILILLSKWAPLILLNGSHSFHFLKLLSCLIKNDRNYYYKHYFNIFNSLIHSFQYSLRVLQYHPNSLLYQKYQDIFENKYFMLEPEVCSICHITSLTKKTVKLSKITLLSKFTANIHIVKLDNTYCISKLKLEMKQINNGRYIKNIILYFSNCDKFDLNSLKYQRESWIKVSSFFIPKKELTYQCNFLMPFTTSTLIIEYFEFYDELDSQILKCPHCGCTVTSKHGICQNCKENAYQCRNCRNINYENLDGFLCNECGFCRFITFDYSFQVCVLPSSIFRNISSETQRIQILELYNENSEKMNKNIGRLIKIREKLLENIDQKKNELINSINDINDIYKEQCQLNSLLSHLHMELAHYEGYNIDDIHNSVFSSKISSIPCYNCTYSFLQNFIETLKENVSNPCFNDSIQTSNIIQDSLYFSISFNDHSILKNFQSFLYSLAHSNNNYLSLIFSILQSYLRSIFVQLHYQTEKNTLTLHELFETQIDQSHNFKIKFSTTINFIVDFMKSFSQKTNEKNFFTRILSIVFYILNKVSLYMSSTIQCEKIIINCVQIIKDAVSTTITTKKDDNNSFFKNWKFDNIVCVTIRKKFNNDDFPFIHHFDFSYNSNFEEHESDEESNPVSPHENTNSHFSLNLLARDHILNSNFDPETSNIILMKKTMYRWQENFGIYKEINDLKSCFKQLILNPVSKFVRISGCSLLEVFFVSLPSQAFSLLNILFEMISEIGQNQFFSEEYFKFFRKILNSTSGFREYLVIKHHFIKNIVFYISNEIKKIENFERNLTAKCFYPIVLNGMLNLLIDCIDLPHLKKHFLSLEISSVLLSGFIFLRSVVSHRSMLIGICETSLQYIIEKTVDDNPTKTLSLYSKLLCQPHSNSRTPIFILEKIQKIILHQDQEKDIFLILKKASSQRDFIRGSLRNKPYNLKEFNGELMYHVQEKICQDLEIPDSSMFELLVNNNIISLDLPIERVFQKIWRNRDRENDEFYSDSSSNEEEYDYVFNDSFDPMIVVYRLRGLDGEATENLIDSIPIDNQNQDPEELYHDTYVLAENKSIDHMIFMLSDIKELSKNDIFYYLTMQIVKTLRLCCMIQYNQKYILSLDSFYILIEYMVECLKDSKLIDISQELISLLVLVFRQEGLCLESYENTKFEKRIYQYLSDLIQFVMSHSFSSQIVKNLIMIIPRLTFSRPTLITYLLDFFLPSCRWFDYDNCDQTTVENQSWTRILTFFADMCNALSLYPIDTVLTLKETALSKGITSSITKYLHEKYLFLSDYTDVAIVKQNDEFNSLINSLSLPFVLKILSGLCSGHIPTQNIIIEENILPIIHTLNRVTSVSNIGPLAETCLEKIAENSDIIQNKVEDLHVRTRAARKKLAYQRRTNLLSEMGLIESPNKRSGGVKITSQNCLVDIDSLQILPVHLTCMICKETSNPDDIIGVYVNNSVVIVTNRDDHIALTTSTSFNCIHYNCHKNAAISDQQLKPPKKEWEGAKIRNSMMKCNNIFPIFTKTTSITFYSEIVDYYWSEISDDISSKQTRMSILIQDLYFLLIRTCQKGGFYNQESNFKLIPYMIQMCIFLWNNQMDTDNHLQMIKSFSSSFLLCFDIDSSSHLLFQNHLFWLAIRCLESLFFFTYSVWKKSRINILKRLLLSLSLDGKKSIFLAARYTINLNLRNEDSEINSQFLSVLVFWGIVDQLHDILNVDIQFLDLKDGEEFFNECQWGCVTLSSSNFSSGHCEKCGLLVFSKIQEKMNFLWEKIMKSDFNVSLPSIIKFIETNILSCLTWSEFFKNFDIKSDQIQQFISIINNS